MYAYRQQTEVRPLHVVPQYGVTRPQAAPKIKRKNTKIKKKNPIIEFFRLIVSLSFLSAFMIFVFPTSYNSLIKQVFYPTKIPTNVGYKNEMSFKNPAYNTSVNLYTIANPVTNYLHNDLFQNQLLLTPTIQKVHSEVTTMYQTSEMSELKQSLLNLMTNYKTIKPAIYVWEYDQGQYVDINADTIYPAASIIKIVFFIISSEFELQVNSYGSLDNDLYRYDDHRSLRQGHILGTL